MKLSLTAPLAAAVFAASANLSAHAATGDAPAAPPSAARPIALMGFGTDVKTMREDVVARCRYRAETFVDKWVAPTNYGSYSVLYFGEKLRGEAQGMNWRGGEAREAAERFLDGGGTVIVAGAGAMTELFGKPDRKKPDPLRDRVVFIPTSLGRLKSNYAKAGKPLSFADDAGNDVLTEEGRKVKAVEEEFVAAFGKAIGIETLPEGEKWEATPLGEPGDLVLPRSFPNRPKLGGPLPRPDGLALFDGTRRAVIALGDCGEAIRPLAEELAWHLGRMCGEEFDIEDGEPEGGPALVYRSLKCPDGFPRGCSAYFRIWREGDKVFLGGEDSGRSRATTYVLEALGCRYLWPGPTGKVIPRKDRVVLPEIAVEDATPFVVRRVRLYGRTELVDRPGNRDFWKWHGLNDVSFMTETRPGKDDGYEWGHYFGDYYPKYRESHPEFFALQPDGTRILHLGTHTERPTFCLSNPGLAEVTAERKIAELKANPSKKAVSLCLPDGATSSWCLCEECRRLDPVNAAPGGITVFFPKRRRISYVALTDRVFTFMNRVAEKVAAEFPDRLLSTYAYSGYTAPPVRTRPHPNLLILSVAGGYTSTNGFGAVERNLAAWASFGNKVLWRPNAHAGFGVAAPDNFARLIFDDISLLGENGVFGVDYDTMRSDWAFKPLSLYMTARAHYNPDRLDFDTLANDYCRAAFGPAAAEVRAYFDDVERACRAAAAANADDKTPALDWTQREKRKSRLLEHLDFDALDARLARAREAAAGDEAALGRIARLQFGNDSGRFTARTRLGIPSKPTAEETEAFKKMSEAYRARDPITPADVAAAE